MFSTVKNYILKKALATRTKEVKDYIFHIEKLTDEDLGLILAFATHIRHHFDNLYGMKLLDPAFTIEKDIGSIMKLNMFYRDARKEQETQSQQVTIPAIILWVHTLRSVEDKELIPYVAKIWEIFSNGVKHVPQVKEQLRASLNLNITDYDKVPSIIK